MKFYVDTSVTNARMQVSVNLIDRLSITGLEYGTTFLTVQISLLAYRAFLGSKLSDTFKVAP